MSRRRPRRRWPRPRFRPRRRRPPQPRPPRPRPHRAEARQRRHCTPKSDAATAASTRPATASRAGQRTGVVRSGASGRNAACRAGGSRGGRAM
ncbi:hypothetical protein EYB45_01790 [Erythrobacteraceae bacterium CFH 75059]|nr:hypothetical protein EYB45_01790 [Erythrobacteraceae bacterium CFH 75059]